MKRTANFNQEILHSNEKFGRLFAVVFSLVAIYAKWKEENFFAIFALFLAVLFALLSFTSSHLLTPLNLIWNRLGILQGKIASPIVLGFIFFLVITPVSLATRLFGRDVLLIKPRSQPSYWIERNQNAPTPDSFKRQF
jgi:hypothetical protein